MLTTSFVHHKLKDLSLVYFGCHSNQCTYVYFSCCFFFSEFATQRGTAHCISVGTNVVMVTLGTDIIDAVSSTDKINTIVLNFRKIRQSYKKLTDNLINYEIKNKPECPTKTTIMIRTTVDKYSG